MNNRWARIPARSRHGSRFAAVTATILSLCLSLGSVAAQTPPGPPPGGGPGGPPPPPSANVSVFATGVESPRGLRFGPDGALYVAEGGLNGTNTTVGKCDQVPPPIGPYMGGKTARISKIDASGNRTTVVDNLPSARDAQGAQSAMIGVADVEFVGTTLYGLITGGGCSHGADTPNTIIKVNTDGTYTSLGDLGAFQKAHAVAKPEPDDFEPDGTWYSMVNVGGAFYAVEPNHGELDKITADGQISRVVDISASQGHIVPTAMVYHDGNFYVGNLGTFPVIGQSKILKITPSGDVSVVATGLSAVLGIAYDSQGRLYALQMSTVPNAGPVPGSGNIVRMTAAGTWEVVASGLFFPTGMTFGPDGMLYVSNMGFGPPTGQIVRVNVNAAPTSSSGTPPAPPTAPAAPPAASPPPVVNTPSTPPSAGGGNKANFVRRLGDG